MTAPPQPLPTEGDLAARAGMAWIPAGTFRMGSDAFYPEERPAHDVSVDGFWIDRHTVTNDDFGRFVSATGYITVAERALDPADFPGAPAENLVPGAMVFQKATGPVDLHDYANWWAWTPGASWKHPLGACSSLAGLGAHPVVHVAYEDAETYAQWEGKGLPTEVEWECAARGGLDQTIFTWGDEPTPDGQVMANSWQGEFPWQNLLEDGYERTSPVGSFPPNRYGLYDMAGNVWEWTSDWFADRHADAVTSSCCAPPAQPAISTPERSYDPNQPQFRIPRRVIKGGSHLCAPNYCFRFRPAARQPQMIDTGMNHLGFRCVSREI